MDEANRLPEWWERTTPAFPVDQTVRLHIPEPEGDYYLIAAEPLGALLRSAGWVPVRDESNP